MGLWLLGRRFVPPCSELLAILDAGISTSYSEYGVHEPRHETLAGPCRLSDPYNGHSVQTIETRSRKRRKLLYFDHDDSKQQSEEVRFFTAYNRRNIYIIHFADLLQNQCLHNAIKFLVVNVSYPH